MTYESTAFPKSLNRISRSAARIQRRSYSPCCHLFAGVNLIDPLDVTTPFFFLSRVSFGTQSSSAASGVIICRILLYNSSTVMVSKGVQ
ncbi:hypothetical protein OPV22_002246 [Ensete ventricosum]|uniref:Uncharacterized protein n=1 Tax=Ensete ventricosum TaxID=4639 RepID=A0AAV8RXD5_ENSVE|nr:hypothetical protein OPV22_002246 [Ensete ventricosum]